jgi:hypothetical protein
MVEFAAAERPTVAAAMTDAWQNVQALARPAKRAAAKRAPAKAARTPGKRRS